MSIKQNIGLAGRYKLDVIRSDGTTHALTDWFENAILNSGLDRLAQGAALTHAHCGTSNTVVSHTDTGLISPLWNTSGTGSGDLATGVSGVAPYYRFVRRVMLFAINTGSSQTIAEVGMGWSTSGSGSMFSRALVSPTVSVLNGERLQLTYELRIYAQSSDVTGSIELNGNMYDYILRGSDVDNPSFFLSNINSGSYSIHLSAQFHGTYTGIGAWNYCTFSTGNTAMSAATSNPTGTFVAATSATVSAYVSGSYRRVITLYASPAIANDTTNGIKVVTFLISPGTSTPGISTQCGFFLQSNPSKGIMKTSFDELTLVFDLGWGRL